PPPATRAATCKPRTASRRAPPVDRSPASRSAARPRPLRLRPHQRKAHQKSAAYPPESFPCHTRPNWIIDRHSIRQQGVISPSPRPPPARRLPRRAWKSRPPSCDARFEPAHREPTGRTPHRLLDDSATPHLQMLGAPAPSRQCDAEDSHRTVHICAEPSPPDQTAPQMPRYDDDRLVELP